MGRSQPGLSHDDRRQQLVVVALPADDDPVRKFSSEKEPHLTLLYLGEPDFSPEEFLHVAEYVQHAASQLTRFGLMVDRRGTLGDKNADVLFFDKQWATEIDRFRDNLLQDDIINVAFHAADQFPEFTPHLTMGFPETPAKPDDSDYNRFSYVRFDRISVWIEDSVGPTFDLKSESSALEVAMSQLDIGQQVVEDYFSHHGVKGMKWGVRRAQKKMAKADKKWEKKIYTTSGAIDVHNAMARRMNGGEIDKHNNNPRWRGVDISKNPKLEKAYYDAYEKLEDRIYKEAVEEVHGKSPSGSKKAVYVNDENGPRIEIKNSDARHADDTEPDLVIPLKLDELGQVEEAGEAEAAAAHMDIDAEEVISHYGVKGMKWGKKKAAIEAARSPESAHAKSVQDKVKKTKVSSATNKELQDVITRLNLEKQFNQLNPNRLDKGQKIVKDLLGVGTTANQVLAFNNSPAGQAVKEKFNTAK